LCSAQFRLPVTHAVYEIRVKLLQVSKWVGQSEQQVAMLFQLARETKPAILFVDVGDSRGRVCH
jgi:SpoVK/Ycf46/Vps4 family AAA+-type ATPase